MKVVLSTLNSKFIHSSLALRYLRAYGRTRGQAYDIVEYTINMPVLDIISDLTEHEADVVGFACYIWNIDMTLHVANLLKAVKPEVKIVLGGPEVSYTARRILEAHSYIDYIVQGEGEEVFAELVARLEANQSPFEPEVTGLLGRETSDDLHSLASNNAAVTMAADRDITKIKGSETIAEVADLGSIPFPYDESDMVDLEHKIIYYESSRGCPFSCQYCLSGNANTVRFFPKERTFQELQWFVDHKVKQVKFVDRTFNCAKHHHLPLMQWMHDVDTNTNFHLEMEPVLMGSEEVALLSTAPKGRMQIEVGVQSTNADTLKAIRRYNNWAHICEVIAPVIKAGRTHVHMDLIVGLPHEPYERFAQSFNDVFSLTPHALQIGFLKLLQGSGLERSDDFEYVYDPKAPYEVLASHVMPYEDIRFLKHFEDVFERFYNSERLRTVFGYLGQRLIKEKASAFHYFEELTEAWLQQGLHQRKLNDRDQMAFLHTYFESRDDVISQELLEYDCLVSFGGKVRGDELGLPKQTKELLQSGEAFWRDEELVQQFIPTYRFVEWRRIRQDYCEHTVTLGTAHILGAITEESMSAYEKAGLSKVTLIIDVKQRQTPFVRPEVAAS
ncbi:B12-binding domain-containing radical SAM protein [Veillonella intestinalis]|uniref:B12-binding domain-containing radical SAM protein n=1 Tax=Veillonella intestinalis TaxID=2941341 RepID=UPI00203D3650|nr:B12-binding domain-containing radical SAM protein [Veillonella intestinalis]